MRVLIVSQYFWPEDFPINDLAKGLWDMGHRVTVLTGMPNYPEGRFFPGYRAFPIRRETYQGVRVVRVPMVPKGGGSALRMALYYLSLAFSAGLVVPLFFRGKMDAVFVYQPSPITVGIPALVLKRCDGVPVFLWVQDLWPETLSATGMVKSEALLKAVGWMVRFIYSHCDHVLVSSRAFVKQIGAMGVPQNKIRYLPNTSPPLFRPITIGREVPERGLLPKGFRVVFAGNVGKAQDLPTILAAVERLKSERDIQWIILGDGTMKAWAEERRRALGLQDTLHLLGRYPLETMPRFFALADVLLVTLRDEMIFSLTVPSKVQSYLACGRPVAAALNGEGARIIEESGAGIAVPSGDSEALAGAVLTLYRTPNEEREKMGRSGRAYFESQFERQNLLKRLNGWIEEGVEGCAY